MYSMSPARKRSTMTSEHKEALAAGRASGLTVRRYLEALEENKPRRGRRPSSDSISRKLADIETQLSTADPLQRLHLLQERKDLQSRLTAAGGTEVDLKGLEDEFVKVAPDYGNRKGINYATWREAGVSAEVLRRPGISRGKQ